MGIRGRAPALAALVLVAATAGCGGSGGATPASTTTPTATQAGQPAAPGVPYAYDTSVPLAYRDGGRVNGPYPIAVRDVSFASSGDRVEAYLAVPPGSGRLPAVIYLHGSGETRERFVLPATWVAGRRAVAMTLTLPSSTVAEATGLSPAESLARQQRIFVDDVVAVRRAIDVLSTLPRVDTGRIGLVGWSLGARVAAVVAGVDRRPGAVVLMSGGAQPVAAYVAQAPPALRPEVRRTLTLLDPIRWIARVKPGTLLLQDGRKDEVVPHAALVALAKAAPKGTAVRWYAAGHELNVAAYRDQLDFLADELRITGPAVAGADTGPG